MDLLWHKSSSASGPNIQTQIRTYFTCYHLESHILAESPTLADCPNDAVVKWRVQNGSNISSGIVGLDSVNIETRHSWLGSVNLSTWYSWSR